MSDTPEGPPPPGPEHARLQKAVGNWKVKSTFFMGGPEPMHSEGTEKVEAFGGFFTQSLFEMDMFGMPFKGSCIMGYEQQAGRYASTWIDSMMSTLYHFTGCYDEATKTLTMTGEGPNPAAPDTVGTFTTVETDVDDDHRTFDMYVEGPDGNRIQMFHYEYERVS